MSRRFGSVAVVMAALIGWVVGGSPASGQLLSSFENDLSSTVGGTWGEGGIPGSTFVADGATDGATALAIHHPGAWGIQAILRTGLPLAQIVAQNDFLLMDVTTTDSGIAGDGWSPSWRQIIPVFNSSVGGWQQNDINFGVAGDDGGSLTETVILDLNAPQGTNPSIKANAQTFIDSGGGVDPYWELFIAFQGADQGVVVKAGDYAAADSIVNAADYTVWRDNLNGTTLTNETASLGIVDGEDYDVWKENFGTNYTSITTIIDNIRFVTAGSGSIGGAAVPEPSSVLLAWGAVIAVVAGCRARQSVRKVMMA